MKKTPVISPVCEAEGAFQNVPTVAILLCSYNGQHYLAEQLDSFQRQRVSNWELWISDDGSTDNTLSILYEYKKKINNHRVFIESGPACGFAANFISLTCNNNISAKYYAYSDQDDIWDPTKLEQALDWLDTVPSSRPALYCARTRLVNVNNKDIGFSPLFLKPLSFENSLMQNVGGGNTMVFNHAARMILQKIGMNLDIVTHDWHAYMVVMGCGGLVFYDPIPSVRYRQHGSNLVGMNSSWMARFIRIRMLWSGEFKKWNDCNIRVLRHIESDLTPKNREILELFSKARNRWLIPRLINLKKTGIYRQTFFGNIGLIVAAIFNKI